METPTEVEEGAPAKTEASDPGPKAAAAASSDRASAVATTVHPTEQVPRNDRRRKTIAVIGLFILVLAAGIPAIFIVASGEKPDEESSASTDRSSQTGPPATKTDASATAEQTDPGAVSLIPTGIDDDQLENEAEKVVRANTAALQKGDARAAWETLSPGRRHNKLADPGYAAWSRSELAADYALGPDFSVHIVKVYRATGEILVDIQGLKANGSVPPYACFCGWTWIRYVGGRFYWDAGNDTYPARKRQWAGDCRFIGYTPQAKRAGRCNRGAPAAVVSS